MLPICTAAPLRDRLTAPLPKSEVLQHGGGRLRGVIEDNRLVIGLKIHDAALFTGIASRKHLGIKNSYLFDRAQCPIAKDASFLGLVEDGLPPW